MHVELHRTAFSQTALELDWTCPVLSEWGNHTSKMALLFKKTPNTPSLPQILWSVRNLKPFARAPGGAAVGRVSQTHSIPPGILQRHWFLLFLMLRVLQHCSSPKGLAQARWPCRPFQPRNPVLIGRAAAGASMICAHGSKAGRAQTWEARLPLSTGEQEQSSRSRAAGGEQHSPPGHCEELRALFTNSKEDWSSQWSCLRLGTLDNSCFWSTTWRN